MTDVLIISNYYPPETGAAANRIQHLAEGLIKHGKNVTVLCPLPNYPQGKIFESYKGSFRKTEQINGITVRRLWLLASNSKNKFIRLFSMLSFSFSLCWFFLFNKIQKTVIVQSPPLVVAFTCVLFLRSKKRKLILNVSDLWPSAGLELGAFKKNLSYNLLKKMERFNYKHATMILGQSQEIIDHIHLEINSKNCFLYRNYPDFTANELVFEQNTESKLKIVYAGLLGVAQGIYALIQELDYSNIELHLYGNGPEKDNIMDYITNHPDIPVTYHGQVSRETLHLALQQYDLTIIPLLNRIYGSVPSKIFEYAKLGMPVLYFGGGEGETIVQQFDLGWVAEAGNYSELNSVISNIRKQNLHTERRQIIKQLAEKQFNFEKQLVEAISWIESGN